MTIRPTAWVLMTALPPSSGHADLIRFASHLTDRTMVIVCTQPGEPLVLERVTALRRFAETLLEVEILHHHETLQQEPHHDNDMEFWGMWRRILRGYGLIDHDLIVASEPYGARLAHEVNAEFIPYDVGRTLNPAKAQLIRDDCIANYKFILPELQTLLRKTITIFGAESVGKTTLTTTLGAQWTWLPEWARGYLDAVGTQVTEPKMHRIWMGQRALQDSAQSRAVRENSPFIIQDTDLFSTVGYWRLAYGQEGVPKELMLDAHQRRSHLYLILGQDEVPFEPDPQRYGGDHRESSDDFWIKLAEEFDLAYIYLTGTRSHREQVARSTMVELMPPSLSEYQRLGQEYDCAK